MNRNHDYLLISLLLIFATVGDAASEMGTARKPTGVVGSVSAESTVVPPAHWVSEDDARLALARILSYHEITLADSAEEYIILLRRRPDLWEARIELADVYLRQKKYNDALRELSTVLSKEPANIRAKLMLGKIYLWQDEYEKAIFLFEQLRRESPTNAEIHLELARAYTWSRRYDQAVDAYRQALHTMEHSEESILIEFADALLYSGKRREAIEHYQVVLDKNPSLNMVRKKLALALSWEKRDGEALTILENVSQSMPEDREITIELARIYSRNNQREKALALLKTFSAKPLDNIETILAVAYLEATLGHAKKARELHLKAMALSNEDERISLKYAEGMMMWGDFYRVEKIYRQHLKKHPSDDEVRLKLAHVMASSERYEEAEGLYRQMLLKNHHSERALLGLSELKRREKNFDESIQYAHRLLSIKPNDREGMRALGDALFVAGKYREALRVYQRLKWEKTDEVQGLLKQGRTYLKLGDKENARVMFESAYKKDHTCIEAQFFRAGSNLATSDDFLKGVIESNRKYPDRLSTWARLYAENGHMEASLKCYRAALDSDPEYFQAHIGLAEVLAFHHHYAASIDLYRQMLLDFPEASKILMGLARVLGWSRNYEDSMAMYEQMHQLNPADPLVLKEKARVAFWAKRFDETMTLYKKLMTPPVDQQLLESMRSIAGKTKDEHFTSTFLRLEMQVREGSVYQGYEAFENDIKTERQDSSPWSDTVKFRMVELLPAYRIQKAADLEKRAKEFAWNKRYNHALSAYEDLIRFNPGNEEAIFDYSQVQCTLGLCDREKETYQKLLDMNPLHSLARQALDRQEIRENSSLELRHWYWREEGRGDLARITWHRSDAVLNIPFQCRYSLKLIGHHWIEKPVVTDKSYDANGFTLVLDGILNPHIKGEAGWTHKSYDDSRFNDRDTGFGHLWFNIRDYVLLGVGFDRTDEIYNYYGLKQGIQMDSWWISATSQITRQVDVKGVFRYLNYNDGNSGSYHSFSAGYAFTDHPRIFKVILSGEYRDIRKDNVSIYTSGTLTDIIHPYWTPKNYVGGGVTLEWYHDVSKFFFCGSQRHFYDLRVFFGTDSTGNAAVRLEGEWLYEFYDHVSVGVTALIHRSREWDANGLFGNIKYRF